MNILLIANPTAGPDGSVHLLPDLIQILHNHDLDPQVSLTTPEEDGEGLAIAAAQAGVQLVIVAGGDGTIEAVARGLVHTPTQLGIIPVGTRNNIAASLRIPSNLTRAVQILTEGESCLLDVGQINERYFLEVVGIGLEASLLPYGNDLKEATQHNHLTVLKKLWGGLRTFLGFQSCHLVVRLDDRRKRRLHTLQVNICNSPRYGIEFALADKAKMNDGKLDVIYLHKPSKWEHLYYFLTAMRGQSQIEQQVKTLQATRIEVSSDPPLKVHADGIELGETPVMIEVIPAALRVRIPTAKLLAQFAVEDDRSWIPALNQSSEQSVDSGINQDSDSSLQASLATSNELTDASYSTIYNIELSVDSQVQEGEGEKQSDAD